MGRFIFCTFICFLTIIFGGISTEELKSVVVLYRHGDRAPIQPYKNDPFGEEFWPLGFGQLTNTGKKRQHNLGKWLRTRYADFLPATYNRNDIQIQSSNVDRCLMSAELNVAGLYPPQGNQIWNEDLKWQPIPIHTVPEIEDATLAQYRPCPKYHNLYEELMKQHPFNKVVAFHQEQMQRFSKASGDNITTLEQLMLLYDTVYIENLYNLYQPLPDWAEELLGEEMAGICAYAWNSYAFTKSLARLRSGPLIDQILSHFEDAANNKDVPKFVMLSGHDSTIATLLISLEVFDNKWPSYASSVLLEMWQGDDKPFINIFYKNDSAEVANLTLPECNFDCDLESFVNILTPIRVNVQDWDKECQETDVI